MCLSVSVMLLFLWYRKKVGSKRHLELEATRKPSIAPRASREANSLCEFSYQYEVSYLFFDIRYFNFSMIQRTPWFLQGPRIKSRGIYDKDLPRLNIQSRASVDTQPASVVNLRCDHQHIKNLSQEDPSDSGPLRVSMSSGFAWAKKQREDHACGLRNNITNQLESLSISQDYKDKVNSRVQKPSELSRNAMLRHWTQLEQQDSFNADDLYRPNRLSRDQYGRDSVSFKHSILV